MTSSVLEFADVLIATVPAAITDAAWRAFQRELLELIGRKRARGLILNVKNLDVLDSFAVRALRDTADAAHLRGVAVVLVGIQPEVAFSLVQLGLTARFEGVATALDLERGLRLLGVGHSRWEKGDDRG